MKPALKIPIADTAQTREEIARLTDDDLHALTKEAFFWGMHPVAMYELRYLLTQLKGGPGYVGDGGDSDQRRVAGDRKKGMSRKCQLTNDWRDFHSTLDPRHSFLGIT
jgi:hypothetical protein